MKFDITHRWTGDVLFTAETDATETTEQSVKLGLAVRVAHRAGANLDRANLYGANLDRHTDYTALGSLKPNSGRPAEMWFVGIKKGDTPETNKAAKQALEWIDQWLGTMRAAFGQAAA